MDQSQPNGVVGARQQLAGSDVAGFSMYEATVLVLAAAACLFVIAGIIRLIRWRLADDPHSAYSGSALIVIGACCLPLDTLAALAVAADKIPVVVEVARATAAFLAIGLVLRALHATPVRSGPGARQLMSLLTTTMFIAAGGAMVLESVLAHPVGIQHQSIRVLSMAVVAGWGALAVAVWSLDLGRRWSRRAAPVFGALSVAESVYRLEPHQSWIVLAALLLCLATSVLAVRNEYRGLIASADVTGRTLDSLNRTLREARDEATVLSEWRTTMVHDASNSVASLRTALEVLDGRRSNRDDHTARLSRLASEEIRNLDHLLNRSADDAARWFDVGMLVAELGWSARALGDAVDVRVGSCLALGRPGDVGLVVRNLLANARRHAPGAPVALEVERAEGTIRIICHDKGPGLDEVTALHAFEKGFSGFLSAGSGIGLYESRQLMRAQGGDLVLEPCLDGTRFVAVLAAGGASPPKVPHQRTGREPLALVPHSRREDVDVSTGTATQDRGQLRSIRP